MRPRQGKGLGRRSGIQIKTPEQFAIMREAGLVVAHTLEAVAAAVRPGITTAELDALAEREIRAAGATPSFLGYHGYPATICTSVNDQIVHGIPSPARSLAEGDIISIDCGAIVRGWHGDAALTVGVGAISAEHAALLRACEDALWQGLAQARDGARLGDISHAVQASVAAAGPYGMVEEYTGHGIGTAMHMVRPARPRAAAAGRPGAGRGADGDARQPGDGPAGRRLDGHHGGRELGRALRAHGRDHPGRTVGADRRGRRPGPPERY
jgi:methionyl aminopeptidase